MYMNSESQYQEGTSNIRKRRCMKISLILGAELLKAWLISGAGRRCFVENLWKFIPLALAASS